MGMRTGLQNPYLAGSNPVTPANFMEGGTHGRKQS
jgi:hypothetical protein